MLREKSFAIFVTRNHDRAGRSDFQDSRDETGEESGSALGQQDLFRDRQIFCSAN